ncbi:hypothetical protein MO973_20620 [Paenibacillus sp. TRM 82003]|nr:hypothetical protein [Paenibacillus sp. TRM 82003]
MSILFGVPRGELLTRLESFAPAREPHRSVFDAEALFAAMEHGYRAIVIHVGLVADRYPWEWIVEVKRLAGAASVVVVSDEGAYDSLWQEAMERLAAEAGFATTHIGGSAETTAEEVCRALFAAEPCGASEPLAARDGGRTSGVVAAVWSASPKDGATTTAASVALALAKHTPLRIGLLDFNLKNPELRAFLSMADKQRSNAPLRPKLATGSLTPEALREAAAPPRKTLPNLYVLPGTSRRDTACDVTPEMMDALLSVARSAFDIALVDVSSYPDNAATVCAVRGADVRWLVAQAATDASRLHWNEWYACYWKYCGLREEDVSLVLNRYDPAEWKPERAAEAWRQPLAGALPVMGGDAVLAAYRDGVPLYESASAGAYAEAIHRPASPLSTSAGFGPLPERAAARRRGSLVQMLSGLF